eukprot:UN1362
MLRLRDDMDVSPCRLCPCLCLAFAPAFAFALFAFALAFASALPALLCHQWPPQAAIDLLSVRARPVGGPIDLHDARMHDRTGALRKLMRTQTGTRILHASSLQPSRATPVPVPRSDHPDCPATPPNSGGEPPHHR